MDRLDGKVALITGAGRENGLGVAIGRALGSRGCRVILTDLEARATPSEQIHLGSLRELSWASQQLRAEGIDAHAKVLDVTEETQVDRLIPEVASAFGGLDILVNNAGIGYLMAALTDTQLGDWNSVLGVNLTGAFLCTRAAARVMVLQGRGGRIINIASQAAKSGFPHMAAYVASKHGMIGLTRTAAIELGPHGITVNAVCPNHVTTGLGQVQNEYFALYFGKTVPEYLESMRHSIPMRREGLSTDTAAAVAFLCSESAAYITGEAVNVSGGCEMH